MVVCVRVGRNNSLYVPLGLRILLTLLVFTVFARLFFLLDLSLNKALSDGFRFFLHLLLVHLFQSTSFLYANCSQSFSFLGIILSFREYLNTILADYYVSSSALSAQCYLL